MEHNEEEDYDTGAQAQRKLFWFNEPHVVIALIQFMQFGYASALALVIMFWDDLGDIEAYWYLFATLACYSLFVYVLSNALPQFTLCTSMGYLVNKEHLNKTLAMHRLQEAERKQKRRRVQLTFDGETNQDKSIVRLTASTNTETNQDDKGKTTSTSSALHDVFSDWINMKPSSRTSSITSLDSLPKQQAVENSSTAMVEHHREHGDRLLVAELVKVDTAALGSQVPDKDKIRLMDREQRRANRRKSVSDGVQVMHGMSKFPAATTIALSDDDNGVIQDKMSHLLDELVDPPRLFADAPSYQRRDTQTSSMLAELVKMDTALLRSQLSAQDQSRLLDREQRRSNRKKSTSDGVDTMSKESAAVVGSVKSLVPEEIKPTRNAVDDLEIPRQAPPETDRKGSVLSTDGILPRPNEDDLKHTSSKHRRNLSIISEVHQREPRKKSSSASEVIGLWKGLGSWGGEVDGPHFTLKESFSENSEDPSELHRQLRLQRLKDRSLNRRKSVSASAVIRSWQDVAATKASLLLKPQNIERSQSDAATERHVNKHEQATIYTAAMRNLNEGSDEPVTIVNLSDATLVAGPSVAAPTARKSVAFSDVDMSMMSDGGLAPKFDHDDDSTADTGKSVGDLSDVGIPMYDFESIRSSNVFEESWHATLMKKLSMGHIKQILHNYFTGAEHAVASHVFGSLVVFFLIGMRLESFNSVTGAYKQSKNTWELRPEVAFWWQATWYMLFIIMSILGMWTLNPLKCTSITEKCAFVAAFMDMLLSVLCLTLLFVADAQRCCPADSKSDGLDRLLGYEATSFWLEEPAYERCCPFWGFRTFGGYGSIEPFTALIGLRVLRFQLAKIIVQLHERNEKLNADHAHESDSLNHTHGSLWHVDEIDRVKIVELWQQAMSKHPHIVEKYGQFSGELFQAMLGLDIIEEDYTTKSVVSVKAPSMISRSVTDPQVPTAEIEVAPHYKLGDQYSSLSTECQGIILAGKLGKPMKSMSDLMQTPQDESILPALPEKHTSNDEKGKTAIDIEFEVDTAQLADEQRDDSMFIAPNARLCRSMRRCDRRLEPLLMEWMTVDVVITDYELVYFEVSDDEDSSLPRELRRKREALHHALQATRGGKGLRLVDVAAGRKVVGHLDLSDITQVHVERDNPLLDVSHLEENEADRGGVSQVPSEYWQKPASIETFTESRVLRWAKVKEDRLRIVSTQGTLYLRYYSDLNEAEIHRERSEADDLFPDVITKDIALQWAQTLVHICGQEQLKQKLPNFGTNNTEELRDYLEVVHFKSNENKGHRRRLSSYGLHRSNAQRNLNDSTVPIGPSFRGLSSLGVSARRLSEKPKSILFSQRSVSAGNSPFSSVHATDDIEEGNHTSETGHSAVKPKSLLFARRAVSIGSPGSLQTADKAAWAAKGSGMDKVRALQSSGGLGHGGGHSTKDIGVYNRERETERIPGKSHSTRLLAASSIQNTQDRSICAEMIDEEEDDGSA